MDYDPVKIRLARMLGRNRPLRRWFHRALNLLFLRAWWVGRELRRQRRRLTKGSRVLDAGMGFGQYSDFMARLFDQSRIMGLEIDRIHLYGADKYFREEHPELDVIIGDAQRLPLESGSFELVLSVDVMEHIPDDAAVFREFHRILRPGGRFIMHTPRNLSPERPEHSGHHPGWQVGEHLRDGYRDSEAVDRLSSAGFKLERIIHGYGPFGRAAWTLLQRIPLSLVGRSPAWVAAVALYLAAAWPLALAAMLLDVLPGEQRTGGSLLIVAVKQET